VNSRGAYHLGLQSCFYSERYAVVGQRGLEINMSLKFANVRAKIKMAWDGFSVEIYWAPVDFVAVGTWQGTLDARPASVSDPSPGQPYSKCERTCEGRCKQPAKEIGTFVI
jgi:hypothetical protein